MSRSVALHQMQCLDCLSMPAARAYRARRRPKRSQDTRDRIMTAVRELLAEGAFHESTVEEVADRAGVARNLRKAKRLRSGTSEGRALALLLVLTSYETFRELRQAGLSERELTKTLQESGRTLLLA